MQQLVWYTCYGSNLSRERFLCYLKGRKIPGRTQAERGAKDPSDPVKDKPVILPYQLYFALHVDGWDGSGVAFIDLKQDTYAKTYGRSYLITEEQFFDVVRQENLMPPDAPIVLDYDALKKNGSVVLFEGDYYGRLLYLGESEGYPCYTFTAIKSMQEQELTTPFGAYYQIIAEGLKESHGLSGETVAEYLTQ